MTARVHVPWRTTSVVAVTSLCLVAVLAVPGYSAETPAPVAPHDISGTVQGTLTFVPLPFTADFPFPYDVGTLGVASGRLASLGDSNVFAFHHPVPPASPEQPSTVRDGRFFVVAANGDRIQGTYEGITELGEEPNQLIGRADWVITGGTGRFTRASGTIQATVYVTVAGFGVFEWPAAWVLEGTISY